MTPLLFLISILLTTSGLYSLYSHFAMVGMISTAGEVLNSTVLIALLNVSVGISMLMKKTWGRIGATGIVILGIITPIIASIYLFTYGRMILAGLLIAYTLVVSKLPTFANNMVVQIGIGVFLIILWWILCVFALRQLRSDEAADFYNDYFWFGKDFRLFKRDMRPALPIVLVLVFLMMDSWLPEKFHRELESKQLQSTVKELETQLEKDPIYVAQKKAEHAALEQARLDKQTVAMANFTPNGRFLWMATSDNKVHLASLADFKVRSFKDKYVHLNTALSANYFSPHGDYFYNHDGNYLINTADSSKVPFTNSLKIQFLGFSPAPEQILTLDVPTKELVLSNLKTKVEAWRTKLPELEHSGDGIFVLDSAYYTHDLKFVFLTKRNSHMVLDMTTGALTPATTEFRYLSNVGRAVNHPDFLISGPRKLAATSTSLLKIIF